MEDTELEPDERELVSRVARLAVEVAKGPPLYTANGERHRVRGYRPLGEVRLAAEVLKIPLEEWPVLLGQRLPEVREALAWHELEVLDRCENCLRQSIDQPLVGRRRRFCSNTCRQAAYRDRKSGRRPRSVALASVQQAFADDRILRTGSAEIKVKPDVPGEGMTQSPMP